MRRLSDQRGFTLVEMLISATLMLIVTGATLTVIEATSRQHRLVEQHNDSQVQVRDALEYMARDLRNLASPVNLATPVGMGCHGSRAGAVARNSPYDLVYCAVGETRTAATPNVANVQRVRYCLDARDPERAAIWRQTQTWATASAPAMPSDTACPGVMGPGNWDAGASRIVAQSVVNLSGGSQRPLFRYAGQAGTVTASDDTSRGGITRIRADVYVDPEPAQAPRAAHLATAVHLRNQNREPRAFFTLDVLNPATPLIELNATASQDPEGQRLNFQFYRNPPTPLPDCNVAAPHSSCLFPSSPRVTLVPPAGPHTYVLEVRDPANLRATYSRTYP